MKDTQPAVDCPDHWFELLSALLCLVASLGFSGEGNLPYHPPCTERENLFEFTQKPAVRTVGEDQYEITFAVKGFCDVTVSVLEPSGKTARRLASGVLGSNAPPPFQKNSLQQTLYWDGKNEIEEYVKDPGLMRIRVALGLAPALHRILAWHEYDTATWDVANNYRGYRAVFAREEGVYVLLSAHPQLRLYGHDGKYIRTVLPPPAGAPEEAVRGLTAVEVEPGRKVLAARQGPEPLFAHGCVSGERWIWLSMAPDQPLAVNQMRLPNGQHGVWPEPSASAHSAIRDGGDGNSLKVAASPDGRWLYASGLHTYWGNGPKSTCVYRLDTEGKTKATVFCGAPNNPGSDNARLQQPEGIACDAQGRLYVCDHTNNRIQIFSGEGKYLKTIPLKWPWQVGIDRKSGGIYAIHFPGTERKGDYGYVNSGQGLRLVRYSGFENLTEVASVNLAVDLDPFAQRRQEAIFTVDSWSNPTRVWVGSDPFTLRIYEEAGKTFRQLLDFRQQVRGAGLTPYLMNCGAVLGGTPARTAADPRRELLYYHGAGHAGMSFDLASGAWQKLRFPAEAFYVDRGLDARGYLFSHLLRCVTRHDPADGMREVPFDYGEELAAQEVGPNNPAMRGAIRTRTQGDYGNRNGFGLNARGDLAVVSGIYYVPRFEEDAEVKQMAWGPTDKHNDHGAAVYAAFLSGLERQKKLGEEIYHVRRWPGRYLAGDTVWVYDRTGELRSGDIVPGLKLAAGLQLDLDGWLYTSFFKRKMAGGSPFLAGRASVIGEPGQKADDPVSGTYFKAPPAGAKIFLQEAQIKMDPWPRRPMEVDGGWIEDAAWLYAGVGPVESSARGCLDWYRRSFVPELHRHSVAALDANGNLVLHIGQYGNADSGRGPASLVDVGGDGIAFMTPYHLAATDTYLCVCDTGNDRIVVLKLAYHAEETVPIAKR